MTCSRSRACEDSAVALSAGASADASCALALATEGGSEDELPSSFGAASASSVFFFSEIFFSEVFTASVESREATFADLRCDDTCFQCRDFLVNLFSATGGPAAVSVLDAVTPPSASSAACNGPDTHTQNPAAMINAERPLALMFI